MPAPGLAAKRAKENGSATFRTAECDRLFSEANPFSREDGPSCSSCGRRRAICSTNSARNFRCSCITASFARLPGSLRKEKPFMHLSLRRRRRATLNFQSQRMYVEQTDCCSSAQIPLVYSTEYNISFVGLEKLHPFDSCKYQNGRLSIVFPPLIRSHEIPGGYAQAAGA